MRSPSVSSRWRGSANRLAVIVAVSVALVPEIAGAYCLTNTCASANDTDGDCSEADGCVQGGEALHWPQRCISFSVQKDGSRLRDISLEDARRIIGEGFYTWTHTECPDGGNPAIEVFDLGPVSCRAAEFDLEQHNANIWVFRDLRWPYDDYGTLALTTVTFNPETGEIFDADVEVNTVQNPITIGDERVAYDFASIATHEAGHVLGLSHSPETSATMYAAYDAGSVSTRQLHLDDVHAICAAIPPNRDVPETCNPAPTNGFSSKCHSSDDGCLRVAPRGGSRGLPVALLLLGALAWRRRRGRGPRGNA